MIRNLKALGLALVAVFAFSAMAAQGASAQDVLTTENGKPALLTGTQEGDGEDNFFSTKWDEDAAIRCDHAHYDGTGTVNSGAGQFVVRPTYEECEALGNAASIDTTGCDFVLTGDTDETVDTNNQDTGEEHATVSLECETGKAIIVTGAFGARITVTDIAANDNLLGVTYTNVPGSPDEVTVNVTVDDIHYEANFVAQLAGITATDDDGFLTGQVLVSGWQGSNHENQVGIETS